MAKKKVNRPAKSDNWLQFELEVKKVFELFGYDNVTHDDKVIGGQCDIVAKSTTRNKTNILAECKYHEKSSAKVNITEVQNFVSKISNYRDEGIVDQGYLITNTGFTSDARAALSQRVSNYVFLMTFDELVQSLLDTNHYLREFINNYDSSKEGSRYVEMKLINTTTLDQTILDSLPGDLIKSEDSDQRYLVIPKAHILKENLSFLNFEETPSSPSIDPEKFILQLQEYHNNKNDARDRFHHLLLEKFTVSVQEVASEIGDEMLPGLLISLSRDTTDMLSWAAESVTKILLDKWEEFGGLIHLKIYNKADFRRRVQRDILTRYKIRAAAATSSQRTIAAPPIPDFFSNILDAFEIMPGEIKNVLPFTNSENWSGHDEFRNMLKYLKKKKGKIPKVNLLGEEAALPALEHYAGSNSFNTLVLIGDYGAGKTTILKKLMRILSEQKLSRLNDPSCRIPLYITLKDYSKVLEIHELIRLFLRNTAEVSNISVRTFKKLNEEGRFVLLLDAFDEMLNRVTKADRRHCFMEIAQLVSKKSKIILTGRPAYFNDYKEFKENLNILVNADIEYPKTPHNHYEVMCLQLLDEDQVEQLIEKAAPADAKRVLNILVNRPNLMDLARRPVLASMIAQTGEELLNLHNSNISARNIYEVYTNKWIQRQEGKSKFNLLLLAEQKSTFLRYLAMQMHISKTLTVHYTALDKEMAQYFNLEDLTQIDYFSHDIRTCSFLSRTDDGYYFFIHKSFMEYFVACEFEQGDRSPFASQFTNDLSSEIIDLLNFESLPPIFGKLWSSRENWEACLKALREKRNEIVKKQRFEDAASLRDFEKRVKEIFEEYNSLFTMKLSTQQQIREELIRRLPALDKDNPNIKGIGKELQVITLTHLGDLFA